MDHPTRDEYETSTVFVKDVGSTKTTDNDGCRRRKESVTSGATVVRINSGGQVDRYYFPTTPEEFSPLDRRPPQRTVNPTSADCIDDNTVLPVLLLSCHPRHTPTDGEEGRQLLARVIIHVVPPLLLQLDPSEVLDVVISPRLGEQHHLHPVSAVQKFGARA